MRISSGAREIIAEASREQAAAVAEVGDAVSHLDQMTQSYASLADSSASNAQRLLNEVGQLETMGDAFRTCESAQPAEAFRAA